MTGNLNRLGNSLCLSQDTGALNTDVLYNVFQLVNYHSCPTRFNFHMHTNLSDGRLEPAELIAQAVEIGLTEMAITDHHSVLGYQQALSCLEQYPEKLRPRVWIGTEITAYVGGIDVHILGYGFDPEHPRLASYLQGREADRDFSVAEKVIAAIHAAGGLAVLAHPSRYRRPATELVAAVVEMGIDGLESYYAYKSTDPWVPTPGETEIVLELAERYHLFSTCGTDTHGTNLKIRR